MIIFLSELQKEHLRLLHQHSTQVLVDFCKLAIDYLNNGINQNKYNIAADKLNVSSAVIQNLVHALSCLIVEGCKHNLLEADFKSSLAIAGFTEEQREVLIKLYSTKKPELSEALYLLQVKDPSYQDLIWRFEIQVASRNSNEEMKPMVLMDFILSMPKSFGINNDDQNTDQETKEIQNISLINTNVSIQSAKDAQSMPKSFGINNDDQKTDQETKEIQNISLRNTNVSIQSAKAARQCQHVIHHILLQCNLPNLLHLTNKLDMALKESKTEHVRNNMESVKGYTIIIKK